VILRDDQDDLTSIWEAAGWHIELLDPDGLHIRAQDWHGVVLARLSS